MSLQPELQQQTPFRRLISGHYGLALTYWTLYLIPAVAFFVAGSAAVANGDWTPYAVMLAATVGWTFILMFGIQRAYKGQDPGKGLSRIAMLFLTINMTNALATLSFI
jgi:hypothetical protein